MQDGDAVASTSEHVVRRVFDALASGDVAGMLEHVHPQLEWTFLDPGRERPVPETCHGRQQLARRVRGAGRPLLVLEEVVACGDKVLVVTHSPGADDRRRRTTGDRNFHVVTVRDGIIVGLRACVDRDEAAAIAGA